MFKFVLFVCEFVNKIDKKWIILKFERKLLGM